MRKALTAVASAAGMMFAPAVAGAQTIHIVNAVHLPPGPSRSSRRLPGRSPTGTARALGLTPRELTRAGGSMTLVLAGNLGPVASRCGTGALACHGVLRSGEPVAVVDANQADTDVPWTVSASHELFEMLVDPLANTTTPTPARAGEVWLAEVADPVENYWHLVRGARVTDFVYPAWFQNAPGQQDAMGWLDDSGAGIGEFEFSCPTGYSQYWNPSVGEEIIGPPVEGACEHATHYRMLHDVRLRLGQGAHREYVCVIGQPLKIEPRRGARGRNTGC